MGSVCACSDGLASENSVAEFEEVFQILVSLFELFQTALVRKMKLEILCKCIFVDFQLSVQLQPEDYVTLKK